MTKKIDLTETDWEFCLGGEELCRHAEFHDTVRLPSTVSQAGKSPLTKERNDGCLTDPRRFEGYAAYRRTVCLPSRVPDCDVFLVMERTRTSRLWIDGTYAGSENSLCTPHRYDITAQI